MIIPMEPTDIEEENAEVGTSTLDKLESIYLALITSVSNQQHFKLVKEQTKLWFRQYYGNDPVAKKQKKERKEFMKNLWSNLKGMGKALKGILKSVYGNWFTKVLKFLLFMAIFDPKGTLLMSLLDFVLKMGLKLMDVVFKMLPKIVKALVTIITEVLPKAFAKIIDAIFGFASKKFAEAAKNAEGPLKWFYETMSSIFSPDGMLGSFLKNAAKILIPVFIGIGILFKLGPMFLFIGKILKGILFVGKIIFGIAKAIWVVIQVISFITGVAVGWIIAIIAGVVLIGVLVYKYWDEIKGFFKFIGKSLKKAFKWAGKILGKASKWFSKLISGIFKSIKKVAMKAFSSLGDIFAPILKKLKPVFDALEPVFAAIGKVLKPIGTILKWIVNLIKNVIMAIINKIKRGFGSIMSGFAMLGDLSMKQIFDSKARTDYARFRESADKKGINLGKVEQYMEKKNSKIKLNRAEKALVKKLGKKRGEDAYQDAIRDRAGEKTKNLINSVRTIKSVDTNKH